MKVPFKYDYRDLVTVPEEFTALEITDAGSAAFFLSNEVMIFEGDFSLNTQADGLGTDITGFSLIDINIPLSSKWGLPVYEKLQITDIVYQTGTIYAFGGIAGSDLKASDPNRLQDQIDALIAGVTQVGIGQKLTSFISGDSQLLSSGCLQFAFDNAVSQSVYSALFAKVGHMFNAQHVEAGDTDLSGSSTLFYPTPVPGKYGRSGIPDIDFVNTDVAANLLAYSTPTGFRDGTIFRYELLTGTTVSGLTDGSEYFLRRVSGTTVSIHSTEANAVANTSPIAITAASAGTFRLTQEGIAIDSAVEDHDHVQRYGAGTGSELGTPSGTFSDADFAQGKTRTSAVKNTNVSNETRATTFYQFDYIKAEAILPTGEVVSAERQVVSFPVPAIGANTVINHRLGATFDALIKQLVWVTATGDKFTIVDSIDVGTGLTTRGYAYNDFGLVGSITQFNLASATGIWTYINQSGMLASVSGGTFELTLVKPNLLANQLIVPDDVTITDSVDVETTFPKASEIIGTRTYTRAGTGTGKRLFSIPAGETIDWGDVQIPDGTAQLEGVGKITIRNSGGNIKVDEYEDSGEIADSGVEAGRKWFKAKNNTMRIMGKSSYTGIALTIADEGMFRNSSGSALPNYGKAFSGIALQFRVFSESVSLVSASGVGSGQTASNGSALLWTGVSTASANPLISWEAIGPWR